MDKVLGYTADELEECDTNLGKIKGLLRKYNGTTDKNIISVLRSRNEKLNDKRPGAIGYYMGYRIIESYVLKNGYNSWRDIFVKSPKEIYEKSGL